MELHILDVGQRACSILKHDDDRVSLIDYGDNRQSPEFSTMPYLSNVIGLRGRLLRLILTSCYNKDVVKGFVELWRLTRFYNLWHNNLLPCESSEESQDISFLYDLILNRVETDCNVVAVDAGYRTRISPLEVLSPSQSLKNNSAGRQEEAALVIFGVTSRGNKILIAGDIGYDAWREMMFDSSTVSKISNIDVLILHGCSGGLRMPDFVSGALKPRVVVACSSIVNSLKPTAGIVLPDVTGVIVEENDEGLQVYVWNKQFALQHSNHLTKHYKYDAWLYCSLSLSRID